MNAEQEIGSPFNFQKLLTILITLVLTGCENKLPKEYLANVNANSFSNVVRISAYAVETISWVGEADLKKNALAEKSIVGSNAEEIWRMIVSKVDDPKILRACYTTQDFTIVAENSVGEKISLIIGSTYKSFNGRYISCKSSKENWVSYLPSENILELGLDFGVLKYP